MQIPSEYNFSQQHDQVSELLLLQSKNCNGATDKMFIELTIYCSKNINSVVVHFPKYVLCRFQILLYHLFSSIIDRTVFKEGLNLMAVINLTVSFFFYSKRDRILLLHQSNALLKNKNGEQAGCSPYMHLRCKGQLPPEPKKSSLNCITHLQYGTTVIQSSIAFYCGSSRGKGGHWGVGESGSQIHTFIFNF